MIHHHRSHRSHRNHRNHRNYEINNLKIKGSLNFKKCHINQTTSNNTSVTINGGSGLIKMSSIINLSTTNNFTVCNDKVHEKSIIILSLMNDSVPILYLSVSNVRKNRFNINVNNPNGSPTGEIPTIAFIIC